MMVLGFDPGTNESGWALLVLDGPRDPAHFVDGGKVTSDVRAIERLVNANRGGCTTIAIEWVEGYAFAGKGAGVVKGLVASAAVAGRIDGIAHCFANPVARLSALQWRHQVIGRPSASDAQVKEALAVLVRNMPVRSNSHVRDACGVALAAGRNAQAASLPMRAKVLQGSGSHSPREPRVDVRGEQERPRKA